MIGIVTETNSRTRQISVSGDNNPSGLRVPSYLPLPVEGGEVVYNEKDMVVTAVLRIYPDRRTDEEMEEFPEARAGEQVLGSPGQGFLGFFKSMKTLIGSTLSNYIEFDGNTNTIRAYGEKFELIGKQLSVSLSAPDDPMGMPIINFKLGGSVNLSISPGQSELKMDLFDILTVRINTGYVWVYVTNPITGKKTYIVEENFNSDENGNEIGQTKLYELSSNFIASMANIEIESRKTTINASDLTLTGANAAGISAPNLTLGAGKKIKASAPNIELEIGEVLTPGAFHITNGLTSHLRMEKNGDMKLGTNNRIILSGTDENVCNGKVVQELMQKVFNYLIALNAALAAVPGMQGFSAQNAPGLAKGMILATVPIVGVVNSNVFIGKIKGTGKIGAN